MARTPLIALIAVPLLVVGCSHPAPAPPEPFRAHGTISASDLCTGDVADACAKYGIS